MFVNYRMEHDELHKIFEEDFGNRLLINPHLPENKDFFCPDNMATPNSFKCEQKLDENKFMLNIHQNVNRKELTTEQLLNFVPKSQLNSPGGLLTPSGLSTLQALSSWNTINPFSYEANSYPVKQEHPPSFPSFIGAENDLYSDFSVPKLPSTSLRRKSAVPSIPLRPSPLSKSIANDNSSNSCSSSVGIQNSKAVSQGKRRSSASAALSVDSSNLKDEARWKTWSRIEEVFLVGAVMDRFFKRGSLSSTRGDDVGTDDCWSFIKATYDKAWTNFAACGGKQIPQERSMNALSRHYKVMKARISQADMNQESMDDFRVFFDEWETVYNVNNCLLSEGHVNSGNNMPSRNANNIGIDFRKRKVRLSVQEKPRLWDENTVNRRSSLQSESSHASHSSNSSFVEEGGYAIRQEQEVTEEYY